MTTTPTAAPAKPAPRCNVIRADGCQCAGVEGHNGPHTKSPDGK